MLGLMSGWANDTLADWLLKNKSKSSITSISLISILMPFCVEVNNPLGISFSVGEFNCAKVGPNALDAKLETTGAGLWLGLDGKKEGEIVPRDP